MHGMWLVISVVDGKWATGTVEHLLGFITNRGVASWFGAQTMIMERLKRETREQPLQEQHQ